MEQYDQSPAASARDIARNWLSGTPSGDNYLRTPLDVQGLTSAFTAFGTKRRNGQLAGPSTKCCASGTCARPVTLVFAGPLASKRAHQ